MPQANESDSDQYEVDGERLEDAFNEDGTVDLDGFLSYMDALNNQSQESDS